jgi:hypothetical protein
MKAFLICAVFSSMLLLPTAGCDRAHDHDHAAPAGGAAGDAHGHGHDHDHHHQGQTRETLGLETAGTYEIVPVQMGKVTPGGSVAFDVEVLGQPQPAAVRFWIAPPGTEPPAKVSPESEKDNVYHVDLPVPATATAQDRLWVEVQPAEGTPVVASFELKR